MNLVDANVLLYAVNDDERHHEAARTWLDGALSGRDTVLIPWVSVLAFLRISTNQRVWEHPLDVADAFDIAEGWVEHPRVVVPEPGVGHLRRLRTSLASFGTGGNLVTDAHLAALAVEHRATVVTFDADFGRFEGVRWFTPTAASA